MTSTGGGVAIAAGQQRVERGDLRAVPATTTHAVGLDHGVGKRGPQLAALPETDDAEAGLLRAGGCRGPSCPANGVSRAGSSAICSRRKAPMTCASGCRYRRGWPDTRRAGASAAARSWRRSAAARRRSPPPRRSPTIGSVGAISRAVIVMLVFVVSSQLASSMRAPARAAAGRWPAVVVAGEHRDPLAEQLRRPRSGSGSITHVRDVLGHQPLDQTVRDRRRTRR